MNKTANIFLLILVFLMTVIIPVPVLAAAYYIDFSSGLDSGSGLATSAAWKHCPGDGNATGNAAATTLTAGDMVIFKGGVEYKGAITVKWSGASGAPITYDGNSANTWGAGRAIINGEGDTLGINARKNAFYGPAQSGVGKSYIVIDNFEIRNLRYVYEDNSSEQAYGVYFNGRGTDIEIKNCLLHHIKKKSQAVATEQGSISVTADSLTDAGQDFGAYAGTPGQLAAHSIKISWLIDSRKSDYYQANAYVGELNGSTGSVKVYKDIYLTQPGWNYYVTFNPTAEGNTGYFYWIYNLNGGAYRGSGGVGISVTGHSNVRISENIIMHARIGISASASGGRAAQNVQVNNNDVSRVSWGINTTAGGYAGEDLLGLKIYGNVIHDFYDAEKYTEFDWGYHNDGIFLFNAGPTNDANIIGAEIYNNYFYGAIGGATALLYLSGNVSGVKIYNNLFASSNGGGYQIRTIGIRETTSVNNLSIYNNVFAKIPGESKYSLEFENSANISLRNNIIYLFDQLGACFAVAETAASGFSSDYNLLHGARIYKGEVCYSGTCYSIEDWVAAGLAFAHDQHSIIRQNPKFKSFPAFAAKVSQTGTTSRIYLTANSNPLYEHSFAVGDHIEYDYDQTMRTVTAVGDDFIDITPALSKNSEANRYVLNWKDIPAVRYDLSLQADSPLIDKGVSLSSEIGIYDRAGISRPQSTAWDIGAYEYTPAGTGISPAAPGGLTVH